MGTETTVIVGDEITCYAVCGLFMVCNLKECNEIN